MPRPQQQQQQLPLAVRALLQLLLFSNIVQQHWTTALPSTATPSLFHVAAAAAEAAADSRSLPTVPSSSSSSGSGLSGEATELPPAAAGTSDANIMDLAKAVAAENDAEHAGSGWDNLETDLDLNFNLATHSSAPKEASTAPTSIEQQDQPPLPPAIPATTLAFANAVAGDTMDSTHSDATPPYAAVDDSYGK